MKFTVNITGQISAEEILTLAEGIEKSEKERYNSPQPTMPIQIPWLGKKVKVHSRYSEKEIKEMGYETYIEAREVIEEQEGLIKLKGDDNYWNDKIIFELISKD